MTTNLALDSLPAVKKMRTWVTRDKIAYYPSELTVCLNLKKRGSLLDLQSQKNCPSISSTRWQDVRILTYSSRESNVGTLLFVSRRRTRSMRLRLVILLPELARPIIFETRPMFMPGVAARVKACSGSSSCTCFPALTTSGPPLSPGCGFRFLL